MAKAYCLHQIELREGVTPEDFEKFTIEEFLSLPMLEGENVHLLKGVKGRDEGKYAMMLEFESAERYEELFLPRPSQEVQQWLEDNAAEWDKLQAMIESTFTDYVVIG
jgi:hypothetical protein